jgi:hypothetical protein
MAEAVETIRAPGAKRSRNREVKTKYDMWLVAKVSSSPSSVSVRRLVIMPALLIITSICGSIPAISPATRFICAMIDKSA